MFSLEGKNALITGATGGIGESIARALHAQGATVSLSGTRAEKLEALAADLGERAFVTPANLSDREAVVGLLPAAEEKMGSVDILVNNAGITRDNIFMRMKDEEWDQVLEVNLTSGFLLCRAAIKGMMKRRTGRIIGITSVVGVTGNPGQVNYAAAKSGIHGFTKALAQEGARVGVTVNAIAPGFIATDMTAATAERVGVPFDDFMKGAADATAVKKVGRPEDIANAVLFLAGPSAAWVSGAALEVHGGGERRAGQGRAAQGEKDEGCVAVVVHQTLLQGLPGSTAAA